MHLLVDGHNLIGQLDGISLADPDDEAQLVVLLRGYAARKRGRQVVVVFDHGVYGHPLNLNGYGVACYFAKSPQDADTHLIRRIQGLPRPRDWALVSSDRRIMRAAEERGVRVIGAREFAGQLLGPAAPAKPAAEKPDAPLSAAEVDEWLELFGEAPAREEPPAPPAAAPEPPKPSPSPRSHHKKHKRKR
jgi:predicted RNA-binding protein with PIN domain